jgi:hypothetical protein
MEYFWKASYRGVFGSTFHSAPSSLFVSLAHSALFLGNSKAKNIFQADESEP